MGCYLVEIDPTDLPDLCKHPRTLDFVQKYKNMLLQKFENFAKLELFTFIYSICIYKLLLLMLCTLLILALWHCKGWWGVLRCPSVALPFTRSLCMLLPTLCGLAHPGDVGLVSLRFVPGRGSTYNGGRPLPCAAVPSKYGPNGCVLPSSGGPLALSQRDGSGCHRTLFRDPRRQVFP